MAMEIIMAIEDIVLLKEFAKTHSNVYFGFFHGYPAYAQMELQAI